MKLRHIVGFAVVALALSATMIGCSLFGTSIDARIEKFVNSLNGDRTDTIDNLVPGSAVYNAVNGTGSSYWESPFAAADKPYSHSITSSSPYDENDTEANITSGAGTSPYKFVLQNTGGIFPDYRIASLWIWIGSWSQVF